MGENFFKIPHKAMYVVNNFTTNYAKIVKYIVPLANQFIGDSDFRKIDSNASLFFVRMKISQLSIFGLTLIKLVRPTDTSAYKKTRSLR